MELGNLTTHLDTAMWIPAKFDLSSPNLLNYYDIDSIHSITNSMEEPKYCGLYCLIRCEPEPYLFYANSSGYKVSGQYSYINIVCE